MIRKKKSMLTLTTFIQHEIPSLSNQIREKNRRNPVGEEGVKLWLFADNMTSYIKNPQAGTKKLLVLISEFSKMMQNQYTEIYCISIH